jgi:cell division ATPase FtsA
LGITQERAEALSRKDFLNNPESALVFPVLQMIGNEGERMLASYRAKYPDALCRDVVLSGGTAQFTGLVRYYSEVFKLPVRIGTPWQRIYHDPSLAPAIEKLGTSFSIALGLALNGVDTLAKKKEKKPFSLSKFFHNKYNLLIIKRWLASIFRNQCGKTEESVGQGFFDKTHDKPCGF